jgi:hypothetical protein
VDWRAALRLASLVRKNLGALDAAFASIVSSESAPTVERYSVLPCPSAPTRYSAT